MNCPLCQTKMLYLNALSGLSYNKDGKILQMCPIDGYCSNPSEEEEKWVLKKHVMEISLLSHHIRIEVVFLLASKTKFKDDSERKQFIAATVKEARYCSDNYCIMMISKAFKSVNSDITPVKVLNTFIILFRKTRTTFKDYKVETRIR